jgi:chromate transporter
MDNNKSISLTQLFIIFFRVGAFTFGGGYAMLPIIQRELVDKQGWLKEEDFIDMIGLTQSAPGPVAVNSAIYLGYRLRGLGGAVSSVIGCVLPSLLVIMGIAWALSRYNLDLLNRAFAGVRPAVVSLITYAAWTMGKKVLKNPQTIVFATVAAVAIIAFDLHPAIAIVTGALLNIGLNRPRKEESQA